MVLQGSTDWRTRLENLHAAGFHHPIICALAETLVYLVPMLVQGRHTAVIHRRGGERRILEILVMLELDGYANLASDIRLVHSYNSTGAAHPHAFGKCNFGGHHESDLDLRAWLQGRIGIEEHALGGKILRKAGLFVIGLGRADGNGKLKIKALRATSFDPNRVTAHNFLTAGDVGASDSRRHRLFSPPSISLFP